MIELVMIFALGFLLASLCALMFLPTLNKRSARLARKRIETMFPMSLKEITAERDYLRAEFAVAQRRMERKVEAAQSGRHAEMQNAGARVLEIAALNREIETRESALRTRRQENEEALARAAGLDRDLGIARTEGATGLAALHALEDAHRDLLGDLKTMRRDRDSVRRDFQGLVSSSRSRPTSDAAEAGNTGGAREPASAQSELLAERDQLRASLTAAEDALAQSLSARREPGAAARDDDELRRKIVEIADVLTRGDRMPAVSDAEFRSVAQS